MKDDDDDAIDLPALPSIGGADETDAGLFDALAIDARLDEGEGRSNLDDSEGLDDFDAASFLQLEDERSALLDDEAGLQSFDATSLVQLASSEYGYRDGDEPLADLDLGGAVVSELDELERDDGVEGLEGMSELSFRGEDELAELPPLDARPGNVDVEDDTVDDLDIGLSIFDGDSDDAPVVADGASVSQSDFEAARRDLLPLDERYAATVSWELRQPVAALLYHEGTLWAAGASLHVRAGEWQTLRAEGIDDEIVSLAHDGTHLIAGTRLSGLWSSEDGGRSFRARNGWSARGSSVPAHVLVDRDGRWWTRVGGALYRSADGERWLGPLLPSPVVDIAQSDRGVAAISLEAREGPATLFVSEDGVRWARRNLPLSASHARLYMRDGRALVACPERAEGPFVEGDESDALSIAAGASFFVRASPTRDFSVRHEDVGDRVVVVEHRRGERARIVFDARSREAADPDGNHRVYDVCWDGERLWLALGGGVCCLSMPRGE